MYEHLGNIDRFTIRTPTFRVTGVDNSIIASEVLVSNEKVSDNPNYTGFEDNVIDFDTMPETKKLFDILENIVQTEFKGKDELVDIVLDNYWAHIHKPYESTALHNHFPCNFSFVYYVKVPENAGQFYFSLTGRASLIENIYIQPEEGAMMFFPSWIDHAVNKNLSNDYRISISGNYIIKDKQGVSNEEEFSPGGHAIQ